MSCQEFVFQSYHSAIKSSNMISIFGAGNGFNPTIVRLKASFAIVITPVFDKFQSYHSAIKSLTMKTILVFQILCFNPTIVRLKESSYARS